MLLHKNDKTRMLVVWSVVKNIMCQHHKLRKNVYLSMNHHKKQKIINFLKNQILWANIQNK